MKKVKLITLSIAGLFIIVLSCKKDDSPKTISLEDFMTTVNENPENGLVLGNVHENSDNLSFNLLEENPIGALSLDPNTGELSILNNLDFDYEEFPEITATFSVSDGSILSEAIITITILDEDDSFNGDVHVTTQEEINAFGENHYRNISGDLIIGHNGSGDNISVVDLSPFNDLQTVGGKFLIKSNLALQNITGFDNLKAVGKFSIWKNTSLRDIPEFNALKTVGTYFGISRNHDLLQVNGFNSLVPNEQLVLYIGGNDSLIEINGFENITSVSILHISFNQSLLYINGFTSLSNIQEQLILYSNVVLIEINGFSNLSGAVNHLEIYNNDQLTNFDVLHGISAVGVYITISYNENLTTLSGLETITSLGNTLTIESNGALSDFCALQTLFFNGGLGGAYFVTGNAYNPTPQDIINGDCSL